MWVTPLPSPRQSPSHPVLIDLVGAGIGQHDGNQGQPRGSGLEIDQLTPHGVHGDPVERLFQRGEESDDFNVGLLTQDMQCPCTVLAGTPRQKNF